ncbi:MAG: hypothetical protein PHO56_01525 [Patescibacteria group bacterium]|nr:hypothetical protein [Patescibacteria group bacterium]
MFKKILLLALILVLFLTWATATQAGFGVSPPLIQNHQLTPGSTYSQQIMLLRSSTDDDLKAEIKVNAPDIASWISLDKGESFILPKGEYQVPVVVTFKIPKSAELGNYTGSIDIKVAPAGNGAGGVSIALGARVDIDLALTNVYQSDFLVRLVSLPDFERLGSPWNWKIWSPIFNRLFYKIKVVMNIENKGNIKIAPSKVAIEVWDLNKQRMLQSSVDKSIKKINPFSTAVVTAEFPTSLPAGQYWTKVKIYKEQEIVNYYEIAFTIAEPGVLGGNNLGIWPYLVAAALILIALAIIAILIKVRFWRFFIWLILLPTKPVWSAMINFFKALNKKFWQWIARQAEKHKEEDKKE